MAGSRWLRPGVSLVEESVGDGPSGIARHRPATVGERLMDLKAYLARTVALTREALQVTDKQVSRAVKSAARDGRELYCGAGCAAGQTYDTDGMTCCTLIPLPAISVSKLPHRMCLTLTIFSHRRINTRSRHDIPREPTRPEQPLHQLRGLFRK